MKMSQLLVRPARQGPRQALTAAHRLLIQAGYIRESAPGLFAALPLQIQALDRLTAILRAELTQLGAEEWRLPRLQFAADSASPTWLGERSAFEIMDRRGARLTLAGPQDGLVLHLLAREINSYKQLPRRIFQIVPAYQDDYRSVLGLVSAREISVLHAWALDANEADTANTMRLLTRVLERVCRRAGLDGRWVDAGRPGAEGPPARRLVTPQEDGPEEVLYCAACGYAAMTSVAVSRIITHGREEEPRTCETVHGPGLIQTKPLAEFLNIPHWKTTKMLLFEADGEPVAVMVRGDCDVSEAKVRRRLGCRRLVLAPPERVRQLTGAEVGYAGPIGLPDEVCLLADEATRERVNFECGANRTDHHYINVNFDRDLPQPEFGDFRQATAGHLCARCETGRLAPEPVGVLGEVVPWGTGLPQATGCCFVSDEGRQRPAWLAALTLDFTGLLAAVVEKHHDPAGIVWPVGVAPFQVHLMGLNLDDQDVHRAAEHLYGRLQEEGLVVLFDDRDTRAGDKFRDAELLGMPVLLTLSRRTHQAGQVELRFRHQTEKTLLGLEPALARIRRFLLQG
ncbi:MAG: hypothetical protein JXQ27_05995 [Acidobacteria bacterium]|nr:hypothetical protein [Acidobacteriota bacterium]